MKAETSFYFQRALVSLSQVNPSIQPNYTKLHISIRFVISINLEKKNYIQMQANLHVCFYRETETKATQWTWSKSKKTPEISMKLVNFNIHDLSQFDKGGFINH